MFVPKMRVLTAIISTCLTFAAMQRVKGLVNLLAFNEHILSENEQRADMITTVKGYLLTIGLKSVVHLDMMDFISPVRMEYMRHWIMALGAICPSKSTGCKFNFPVIISPLATTFKAASNTHKQVTKNPNAVKVMSPKVAIATPSTTGSTANCRLFEISFFNIKPIAIVNAGTRLRMTWLKLTETYLSDTLPTAMFKLNMMENNQVNVVSLSDKVFR